jgi:hypothetical protein
MLALQVSLHALFLIAAVPSLIAVAAILWLMRLEPAKEAARQPVPA